MRVPDRALKCVVFVGKVNDRGQFLPYGTGFIVRRDMDDHIFHYIVTAHHALRKIASDQIYIRINVRSGGAQIIPSRLSDWRYHPNPRKRRYEDVAVISTSISLELYDFTRLPIDSPDFAATPDIIARDEIDVGDDIYTVGLFTRHWGETKNAPLVRCGNIAAIPDEPVFTRDGYMDAYLVEAKSIGGLSGSPVFVHMPPYRMLDKPPYLVAEIVQSRKDQYLLGMVQGYFEVENSEDAITEDDEAASKVNTGIANVIPVYKIMETVDHPDFVLQRREALERKKRSTGLVETSAFPALSQADGILPAPEAESAGDDWYPPEEAARRFEGAVRRALATPPKPHSEMKLGKPRGRRS